MRNKTRAPRNLIEVIQCVQATGSHFFDKDAMRSFGSRLADDVYPTKFGTFFITSEKDRPFTYSDGHTTRGAWDGQRRYTVRFVACRTVRHERHHYVYTASRGQLVDTMPDNFGAFGTLNKARKFARESQARLNGLLIKDRPILFVDNPAD